jgi:hypothetical protein
VEGEAEKHLRKHDNNKWERTRDILPPYRKIIPLDSYSKDLSNGIIFMSNISYFLD